MDEVKYDKSLGAEAKKLAKKLGAEMIGVGPVERWKEAPLMLSPQGLLPTATSVITFGISFLDASMELTEKEMSEHWYNPYDMCENMTGMNERLNKIAFNVTKLLENRGYRSLYSPVSNLWRVKPYKSIEHPFAPTLVHRYAAVACGLGEIGWSGLFLSPEYGPRQRLIPVVTEAPLEPTPMYSGPRLCDKCMECVKRCPLDCYRKEVRKINQLNIGGRMFEFPDINKWRCFLDYYGIYGPLVPDKITEEVANRIAHSDVKPKKSIMDSGMCLCSCVPPELRFKDEKYPRGIRRKKDKLMAAPQDVSEKLLKIAQDKGLDFLGIAESGELRQKGIELEEYLPDAACALAIGSQYADSYMGGAARTRLKEAIFDMSHCLQKLGYATLPIPRLSVNELAAHFGFEDAKSQFTHLLTEFPLKSLKIALAARDGEKAKLAASEIKALAKARGADLVGISSVARLDKAYPAIKALYEKDKTIEIKREWVQGAPTSLVKEVAIGEIKVKKASDYLAGARSVIVLGIHYPATILERVAQPPAENVGAYAGATQHWGVTVELGSLVFDLVRFLEKSGYQAAPVSDLFGTAYGANAWGPNEGTTASRFAAVCAGLGEFGWNGAVLTPEYGLTQRFVCIVTDAQLAEDPLYQGEPLCKKCRQCVPACPVNALGAAGGVTVKIEDKVMEFARRDRLRCDWSAKCALVGEEGPKYLGMTKDFPPPEKITAEAVSGAFSQLNPVEQSWNATFEKCVSVCPTTAALLEKMKQH